METPKYSLFWHYLIILLYLEILFKVVIFGFLSLYNVEMFLILLFVIIMSFILTLISQIFKGKINIIIVSIMSLIFGFWFGLEIFLYRIYDNFFSISSFGLASQIVDFLDVIFQVLISDILLVLLLFIPFIFTLLMKNKLDIYQQSLKEAGLKLLFSFIFIGVFLLSINNIKGYSESKKLFYDINNFDLNMEKLGVNTTLYLDVKRFIWPLEEKIEIQKPIDKEKPNENTEIVYEANIMNIDFQKLFDNEKDSTLKNMHEYFLHDEGTLKNKYTGMFKGKNLIFVTAESFSQAAVSKELTPTLYKMANETFIFENFYTPVNLSTLGGEFQVLTSQFANQTVINEKWRKATVNTSYGLANKFKEFNYNAYAYHNGEYYFQGRNKYLANLGFDKYLACKNGIEKIMNCNPWPRSDMEMFSSTVNQYIDNTPFLTYYMTNSGHLPYYITGPMYKKHREKVEDLPYTDNPKAYLASMIELDLAMEELIKNLTTANILDNTVIVIVADHYPYDLTLSEMNEMSKYTKDDIIEINRSALIIWNSSSPTVRVSKVANQLDVLPTVYNLFGIEYDSRLFMGKDILSNDLGLAFFSNRSWISDFGKYYSRTNLFDQKEKTEVDADYVKKMNTIVNNRINMSKLILQKDYFAKVKVND